MRSRRWQPPRPSQVSGRQTCLAGGHRRDPSDRGMSKRFPLRCQLEQLRACLVKEGARRRAQSPARRHRREGMPSRSPRMPAHRYPVSRRPRVARLRPVLPPTITARHAACLPQTRLGQGHRLRSPWTRDGDHHGVRALLVATQGKTPLTRNAARSVQRIGPNALKPCRSRGLNVGLSGGVEGIRTPDPLTASRKRRCWSVLELACRGEDTRFPQQTFKKATPTASVSPPRNEKNHCTARVLLVGLAGFEPATS